MSITFRWFNSYKIEGEERPCYSWYRIIYDGGGSTSHSAGNVIRVNNVLDRLGGFRIPYVIKDSINSFDDELDLIKPTMMASMLNKVLQCSGDLDDMRDRIERMKELSDKGYYICYEY